MNRGFTRYTTKNWTIGLGLSPAVLRQAKIIAEKAAYFSVRAMSEMQRFYPPRLNLDRVWVQDVNQAVYGSEGIWSHDGDSTAAIMQTLSCRTEFDANAGCLRIGVGTAFHSGREAREWLANLAEKGIQHTLLAVNNWAELGDAWYAALHCGVLGWK
ncbi:hypothetical protein BO83DRAFT_400390 [Aspergillus eucalypticola CBS 122712]|uniref:Uncharacterized protein n=1 Tax=Aspergillus eucalypticola (strain CBS 122712 / IBT 29274) TaxID=1448314 RepID=A0A317V4X8_ASPEC|nr:uncharacterized protein BO83DRAFT_400390 [Aspergillus eucalypticola CBS 122712]PWY68699.1 hypothetical protein BO83DRAFT_400390 [Aspergillus eucalypticola CBS 122712]